VGALLWVRAPSTTSGARQIKLLIEVSAEHYHRDPADKIHVTGVRARDLRERPRGDCFGPGWRNCSHRRRAALAIDRRTVRTDGLRGFEAERAWGFDGTLRTSRTSTLSLRSRSARFFESSNVSTASLIGPCVALRGLGDSLSRAVAARRESDRRSRLGARARACKGWPCAQAGHGPHPRKWRGDRSR
jgi:hypothetical protein